MKNFLVQLLVLLPSALIGAFATICIVVGFNMVFIGEFGDFFGGILALAFGFGALVGLFFFERWLRDLDDEFIPQIFFAITMPFRLPLQLISGILAFIGIFCEGLESDYEYSADGFFSAICYMFFTCTFSL